MKGGKKRQYCVTSVRKDEAASGVKALRVAENMCVEYMQLFS